MAQDGSKTTTVYVKVKTAAAEVAVELGKLASATNVTIDNSGKTVTVNAVGVDVSVAELKAVLTITGAEGNTFDIVKDASLGGTVSASDSEKLVTGMQVVATSAETGAEVAWTITKN